MAPSPERVVAFTIRLDLSPYCASGKIFGRLPRAPYGVHRLDPSLEGAQTFGHYQTPTATEPKGIYYYNGSDLKSRTLLDAAVLIYHELIPGHHLQMSLQSENALPEFRRYGCFEAYPTGPNLFAGAFTEGWACYATLLADELGMYADPYDSDEASLRKSREKK